MSSDNVPHRPIRSQPGSSQAGCPQTHRITLMSTNAVKPNATPKVTELRVVPVAGRDSMLMNLSGAHGPFFTRNIVILKDSSGNTGVGEVPGGENIRKTIDDARPF